MNAAQVNALPLSNVLKILGYDLQKERSPDQFDISSFRGEKAPTFHVPPSLPLFRQGSPDSRAVWPGRVIVSQGELT